MHKLQLYVYFSHVIHKLGVIGLFLHLKCIEIQQHLKNIYLYKARMCIITIFTVCVSTVIINISFSPQHDTPT